MQVLREFNHVNPQDDEEGKIFSNTRVISFLCFLYFSFGSVHLILLLEGISILELFNS